MNTLWDVMTLSGHKIRVFIADDKKNKGHADEFLLTLTAYKLSLS